jgi:hypothetical protein
MILGTMVVPNLWLLTGLWLMGSTANSSSAYILYPEVKDELTGGQFTFIDDSKVELSKLSP